MFSLLSLIYFVFFSIAIRSLERNNWVLILAFFCAAYCFYFVLAKLSREQSRNKIFYVGILLRIGVIFTLPIFSDDFYRFLWDGFLVSEGHSPYELTPVIWKTAHFVQQEEILFIFDHLNSKEYFSVYPFALQFLFLIPWLIGIKNLFFQVACLQLILLGFDIFCLYLFKKSKTSIETFWLYAGNPILILETASQIHFEVIVLLLLLLFLRKDGRNQSYLSGFFYALILQIKLNFILIFPVILKEKNIKIRLINVMFVIFSILILSFTVFANVHTQLESGIGLFFHSFRFHSLFEQIIYLCLMPFPNYLYLSGSISMLLGGMFYLVLLIQFEFTAEVNVMIGLLVFLLVSPVVHSWYIIPFVGLSFYFQYHTQLSIILSIFSAISYLSYGISGPLFTIGFGILEILVLGVYVWKKKPLSFLQKIP